MRFESIRTYQPTAYRYTRGRRFRYCDRKGRQATTGAYWSSGSEGTLVILCHKESTQNNPRQKHRFSQPLWPQNDKGDDLRNHQKTGKRDQLRKTN